MILIPGGRASLGENGSHSQGAWAMCTALAPTDPETPRRARGAQEALQGATEAGSG